MWSNSESNLASYLALTAHWIAIEESSGRLSIKSTLIGFHCVKKKHSGINVAKNIFYLLDRAKVMLKVCCLRSHSLASPRLLTSFQIGHFTLDNAENNTTALQELQSLLAEREVTFNPKYQRVRCFMHIINICSSHIIASMTSKSSTNIFKLSEDSVDGYSASGCTVGDDSDDDNFDYDPDINTLTT